jgi:hypothetical protein
VSTALAVAHDLLDDLGGPVRGTARCRFCGLTDWSGVIERHERVVHPNDLLDLEECAA